MLAIAGYGQADEICQEFGETPSREAGKDNRLVPYVYGRIVLKGLSANAKPPRVTVLFSDSAQPATRQVIGRSGNYCFQKRGSGGMIVVDVDGVEVARKTVSDIGTVRQREDFDVYPQTAAQNTSASVVSTKFARPPNEKTVDLYKKASEAEENKRIDKAIELVKQITAVDAEDFTAWAKLGSLYIVKNSLGDAEKAYKRSLELRGDYTPAMMSVGIIKALQGDFANAIAMFQRAVASEPTSARAHRLLGEAYLQNRQGTLGLASLDEALRLDPLGMAECHLLKARLYDLAGAKNLASSEYKAFLSKVADHPDRKKFEKYIRDNPE